MPPPQVPAVAAAVRAVLLPALAVAGRALLLPALAVAGRTLLLPALAVVLAVPGPASAQDADAPPLAVPDLTVTAEDPLILLPPLGPPVDAAPLIVPRADGQRAAYQDAPAVTAPGLGPPPPPDGVLRIARSVETVERNSEFRVRAGVAGVDELREVPAAVSYRNGGMAPAVQLGLSGLVPVMTGVAGGASAYAALESPSWRSGIDGSVTVAGDVRAGQVALSGATGNLSGAVSVQSWQAHAAAARWRTTLSGQLAVPTSPAGPQAHLGLASLWSSTGVSALPAMHVHYGAPRVWHLAAGIRPVVAFPGWLSDLVHDRQVSSRALRPEEGWLAWLGGGIGAVDLRVGWAHGLTGGADAGTRERTLPAAHADLLLVGVSVHTAWNTGAGGPVTVGARAGANWDRDAAQLRLRADGEWQITASPPITLLLGGRWIGAREYHAVYPDEDWTLGIFRDEPGAAVVAGVRWSPVWGHRLQLVGGINLPPAGDLTWGAGIEYARDVVRLTAPPP